MKFCHRKERRAALLAAFVVVTTLALRTASVAAVAPPAPGAPPGIPEKSATIDPEQSPGALVYRARCSGCHEGQAPKAPSRTFLQLLMPEAIHQALTVGIMQPQASGLSDADKRAVAVYLAGSPFGMTEPPEAPICVGTAARFEESRKPDMVGWGFGPANNHFIPEAAAALKPTDLARLKVKWTFAYPAAVRARSRPTFGYGALFVGSQSGKVYALDAKSGCIRWTFKTSAEVRTSVVLEDERAGVKRAYFGDLIGRVYAVDAMTGRELWRFKVDDHPSVTITGTPVLQGGTLYVPVSSLEEGTVNPDYPCCTFRGSVVAIDAATGKQRWKRYMIDTAAHTDGVNSAGRPIFSPSGAAIWNSPTIDVKRGVLYVGTGNNYTGPAGDRSNAVVAVELKSGRIVWSRQITGGDAWNVGCMVGYASCPANPGPDTDIGSGTMLVKLADGHDRILAGLKSGLIVALDPDAHDKIVWSNRVGHGSVQGGVQFGMAYDGQRLYVPISDMVYPVEPSSRPRDASAGAERPGLYALDAATGKNLWSNSADDRCAGKPNCNSGILASIAAIPGAVFAGHMDGRIRAYDSGTGAVLWQFDTLTIDSALAGAPVRGGSIGGGGPVVYDGMVYTNSGYGVYAHMPGNALIAFSVDGH